MSYTNEAIKNRREVLRRSLENQGVPWQYALPAALILEAEMRATEEGKVIKRTSIQQETINAAFKYIDKPQ